MAIDLLDDFKTFDNYIDLPEIRFNKIMKFIENSYKDRMKRLRIK